MNAGAAIVGFLGLGRITLGAHFGGVGWGPLVGPAFTFNRK